MTAWRHVRTIGRTECRRRWRSLLGNPRQLIAIALVGLFALPFGALAVFGAFVLGGSVAGGELDAPLRLVRTGLVYAWVFAAGFGGFRAYATAIRPDRLDGLLTTVSPRTLVGGLVLAEVTMVWLPMVLLGALAALAFAAGAGSVLAAPLAFATICLLLATALATGIVGALVIRNTGVRSVLLTRLRTVFSLLLGVVYFGLIFTQQFDSVFAPLYGLLAPTPVGWYADLLLVGTVPEASILQALGVVAASGAFLFAGGLAISRLAAWLWYADGVHVEHEATSVDATERAGGSRLASVLPRPMAGVASVDYRRARRAPITLSFVLYPLFVLIGPVSSTVQTGSVGGDLPLLVVLCGAWITGATFTLNVVGNEGAVLPVTLLGADPGRSLVGGHVAAAALLGVPVTVAATAVLAVASPYGAAAVATLAATALVLAGSAGPIATGVGAAFPRFEAVRLSRSTRAIVPSLLAFTVYSILVVLVALPALLAHTGIVGQALAAWLGTSPVAVAIAGTVLTAVLAGAAGWLSAAYAVRSVDSFHFD